MSKPVLWHFAISHYNEKVRWALDWKEIEHRKKLRYVEYPLVNTLRTRQMQTPILFHKGHTLVDSTRIIAYLEKAFPEKPLYPADAADRQKTLELEDFFDEELGPHIRALVVNELFEGGRHIAVPAFSMGANAVSTGIMHMIYPRFVPYYKIRHNINPASLQIAKGKVQQAIDRFEDEIGDDSFLVGNRFTVADLTAAALFFAMALPGEYPYRIPIQSKNHLRDFNKQFKSKRLVEWVNALYREYRYPKACTVYA